MDKNTGYVIGIDGGGTHLRIRAASSCNGEILSSIDAGSLGYFSKDPEKAVCQLESAAMRCLSAFNGKIEDCACIVCGMSGVDSSEDKLLLESLLRRIYPYANVIAMNDGELAMKAITGGVGILLNSGTGSICVGCNPSGKYARVGGWPYTVYGDEGSGTWVSLKVVREIGNWFDNVIGPSFLIDSVLSALNIHTEKEYVDFCLHFTLKQLSVIPPIVDKAAAKCDKLAIEIITEAYTESFLLADRLACVLQFREADAFKIGIWGSNILNSPLHMKGFIKLFKEKYPNAEICIPENDLLGYATEMAFLINSPDKGLGGQNEL